METVIVLNPASGGGVDPAEFAAEARARLACRIVSTEDPDEGRARVREAAEEGAERVIAAGGDGTVRSVVQGLLEVGADSRATPDLGVVPLGTGNDLARSLGIPLEAGDALDLLASDPAPRPLDLIRLEIDGAGTVAVNAVVAAAGGRVGQNLEPEQKAFWGPLSYLRSAVEVAFELEPVAVDLEVDGHRVEALSVLNVVVANGAWAAGGVPIAPGASPVDGSMDVALVAACTGPEVARIGAALLAGRDPESDAYRRWTVSSLGLRARGDEALPVSVDGENGTVRALHARLDPGRLGVLARPVE